MNIEILHKYIIGDASREEKEAVTRWLDADEKNMKEFLAMRKLYNLTIWQQEQALAVPELSSKKTIRRKWRIAAQYVLNIAALFVLVFFFSRLYPEKKDEQPEVKMQSIYVPAGERVELTLSDGTKVWLNAKTTLTFPSSFDKESRMVTLNGEGYFNVTHKEGQPFIVQTEQYNIKVLGTEFNVYAYSDSPKFETYLLNGSVQIESADHEEKLLMEPNKKAYLDHGKLTVSSIEKYDYFLWKDGLICFDDNTIDELFKKLQTYFDVQIIVENKQILNQRYTGKFRTNDGIEHILKTLQLRTRFDYEKKDDRENIIIIK